MKNSILIVWLATVLAIIPGRVKGAQDGGGIHIENDESIPHQPNYLGKFICLGIGSLRQAADENPVAIKRELIGSNKSVHDFIFEGAGAIRVVEELVPKQSCAALPLDESRWGDNFRAKFCLSDWRQDSFIRIEMVTTARDNATKRRLATALYSVGPCQIGSSARQDRMGYFYGEPLKVGSLPMLLPKAEEPGHPQTHHSPTRPPD